MPASTTERSGLDSAPLNLNTPLRRLPLAAPIVVAPAQSLRDALLAIDASTAEVAIVVDSASSVPLGIVTLRDAVRMIVGEGCDPAQPVAAVMTAGLATLSADASVHEATVHMFRRGMPHLILTDAAGRLVNVVSQGDLYGVQAADSATLAKAILAARSIEALVVQAAAVRSFAARRLAEGTGAEALCEWISALNDLLTLQAIEIVEGQYELPYVPWSWMVFGSEGRLEQTLVTDQDNGIIFATPSAAAAADLRRQFLPFAGAVNDALAACGFPLCKGGIMAGNPSWCLSLDEWRQVFHRWMTVPDPKALLNSTIFFDCRSLYGNDALSSELRTWLLAQARKRSTFLHGLAASALEQEAPLSWLRDFRYDTHRDYPHTLDLKAQGIRLFVDAARVFALAHGIEATNTVERLRAAGAVLRIPVTEIAAIVAAFFQIQRLRLQNQVAGEFPESANRLRPEKLHELDRHILKEAFRQARRLQQRLRLDYPA